MLAFNFNFKNSQKFVSLFVETSPTLKNSWLCAWIWLLYNYEELIKY